MANAAVSVANGEVPRHVGPAIASTVTSHPIALRCSGVKGARWFWPWSRKGRRCGATNPHATTAQRPRVDGLPRLSARKLSATSRYDRENGSRRSCRDLPCLDVSAVVVLDHSRWIRERRSRTRTMRLKRVRSATHRTNCQRPPINIRFGRWLIVSALRVSSASILR